MPERTRLSTLPARVPLCRRPHAHLAHTAGGVTPALAAADDDDEGREARAELETRGYTIQDRTVDEELLGRLREAARAMVGAAANRCERGFAMRAGAGKGAWGLRGVCGSQPTTLPVVGTAQ